METNIPLPAVPPWLLIVIGLAIVAQLSFEIWALVHMLKRPAEELTLGGRKWLWAILILGISWIGAIIYLAAGRKPVAAIEPVPAGPVAERAGVAVDALYGTPKDGDGR